MLKQTLTEQSAMELLCAHEKYQHTWMVHWMFFDETTQTYKGYAPDNEVIATGTADNLDAFFTDYSAAATRWADTQ